MRIAPIGVILLAVVLARSATAQQGIAGFDITDNLSGCTGSTFLPKDPQGVPLGDRSCTFAAAGGHGTAFAVWDFGSIFGSASVVGVGGPVYSTAVSYASMSDYIDFGAGPRPTDILFWLAVEESRHHTGSIEVFADVGLRIWGGNMARGLNGAPLRQAFTVGSGSVFDFALDLFGGAGAGFEFGAIGAASATGGARIRSIQFFSHGVDISNLVTPTFGSGHPYQIGAVVTPVPEPATVALLGTGLGVLGLLAWRRRRSRRA